MSEPPQVNGTRYFDDALLWQVEIADHWVYEGEVQWVYPWTGYASLFGEKQAGMAEIRLKFPNLVVWLPFSNERRLQEGESVLVRVDEKGELSWSPKEPLDQRGCSGFPFQLRA